MDANNGDEEIRTGHFVELRSNGLQGIVYKVFNDLWAFSPDSREVAVEFLRQFQPDLTEDSVPDERFIIIAYLNSAFLFAFESEVRVISESEIKFNEYPLAFKGNVYEVWDRREEELPYWNEGYELRIITDRRYDPRYQPHTLYVVNPTITNYADDVICGTRDFVVIINPEGLAFPYRRDGDKLIEDWH